jgi:misacylated tRNA(Ala) deacylase
MTPSGGQVCYVDAYARSAEARVAAVEIGDPALVVLDRTVFYPGGGGQPSDRGLVIRAADGRSWTVRAARKSGAEIVHELEPDGGDPPGVGDVVRVDLDWARRLALMRTHTALHALCGVVWRDYGALVTGGNMEPGSGRMDFEFERMSGELVDAIEANEIVGLDLQADGGTHVANTREVGRIRVTGYESKGRINKRIRIAVEDA